MLPAVWNGGVLEPVPATTTTPVVDDVGFPDDVLHDLGAPMIIEDNYSIGVRAGITNSVIVRRRLFIDFSTKIYDRVSGEITHARIPAGSVVVPGNLPAADDTHGLYCVVIVEQVDTPKPAANWVLTNC